MWSVREYARMPPPRLSGSTLGTDTVFPSESVRETVPAPLYPESPNTVGDVPGLMYFNSGAIKSCEDVAKQPGFDIRFEARIAERPYSSERNETHTMGL